ncbi:MAG TPA: adenylate/guanylate cyclase domain-containing protein [Nitrososphaerales archaeon]|nr:adenylate/guanylate cyclase domain-containing protein [Nitrososphaerales archaeon]
MAERQRRLAAIMFTDMVGSTSLAQEDEELSLQVVDAHRKLLRPVFARHGGREVKTMGDGFLVEFSSALDGARCAYDIQRAAREFNISVASERRVRIRVGVHVGDVVESEGDISGDAVNIASRIEHLAEEGGVCVTRQVYDQVRNKVDLRFESLGEVPLKNVREPVEVFRMLMPWSQDAQPPRGHPERERIAVLPFANLSPNPEDGYFADGVTEEVITTLSNVSGLSVISRTSAMKYKGTSKGVGEIGKELGVGSILEGSLRKSGNKIRVTTQLIDVAQDRHLWAQNYDRELTDVFEVQSDIARQVSEALKTRILPQEGERIDRAPTTDIQAYELYLKGRRYWDERSVGSLKKSLKCFETAIERDPGFALAHVGLALSYSVMVSYGHLPGSVGLPTMEKEVTRALELDPTLAEAHTGLGSVYAYRWDWLNCERELRKAIELSPSYATAHQWLSICLSNLGRLDESLAEMERAHELDPLSLIIVSALGVVHSFRREYEEAEALHKKALSMDPNFQPALTNLGIAYMEQSKRKEVAAILPQLEDSYGGEAAMKATLATYLYWLGRDSDAEPLLQQAIAHWRATKVGAVDLAGVYMTRGDYDEAFRWLGVAYEEHSWLLSSLDVDPFWDPIRPDPRFADLLRRVGLPVKPQV